ncbi:hypothetical protein SDC9_120530 [bioreactor metagenome]|uniref:Uncharacterized protein n=1 Tax=bioreactor metagenome TaxID=1076179 RepID=A0A645C7X3_9ZZZZ
MFLSKFSLNSFNSLSCTIFSSYIFFIFFKFIFLESKFWLHSFKCSFFWLNSLFISFISKSIVSVLEFILFILAVKVDNLLEASCFLFKIFIISSFKFSSSVFIESISSFLFKLSLFNDSISLFKELILSSLFILLSCNSFKLLLFNLIFSLISSASLIHLSISFL